MRGRGRDEPIRPQYNIAPMTILAIETVTRRGSLAWRRGDDVRAVTGQTDRTHGERLPGEITDFLGSVGQTLDDIDLFAVVSGPGSFTGLRVGVAALQGLALATGRPALGVPTLDAMAAAWRQQDASAALVVACLDGQRQGEVFYAAWAAGEGASTAAVPVIAPAVALADEAAAHVEQMRTSTPVVVVGSGALRYAPLFERRGSVRVVEVPTPLAAAAAALAAERALEAGPPHALRPIYLRRPDAVIARNRQTP